MPDAKADSSAKMEAPLMNSQGQETGKLPLPEKVFGQKPSPEFLHEYVAVYMNNQRGFNAHTKTRSEVSGSGKKPWKQKHTGRARAGSIRSPLWRHGGVVFGPRSGRVRLETTRRKANLALAQALSARFKEGAVVFVEGFSLAEPKTKEMAAVLKRLGGAGRMLVIIDRPDPKVSLASRNLPETKVLLAGDLNAYEVLRSRKLFMTRPAVEKLSARSN